MTTFRFEKTPESIARGVIALLVCVLSGCGESPAPPPAPVLVSEEQPPRLVATFHVERPEQVYAFLRAAAAPTLPQALPLLLAHVLGLPPDVSGRFRTDRMVNGALALDDNQRLSFVVGLPVSSGRELIAELTLGARAPFEAHSHRRFTELRGAVIGPYGPLSLGVAGNLLVVGDSARALQEVGPYLAGHTRAGQLTSELQDPGIALRTVAPGAQLQGLLGKLAHAAWDTAATSSFVARLNSLAPLHEHPLVSDVFTEWIRTLSAYAGHLESSDIALVLDGSSLDLTWDAKASTLPVLRSDGRTACRDLASLPPGVGPWMLGAGSVPDRPTELPDWDVLDPGWQYELVHFLASVVSETPPLRTIAAPQATAVASLSTAPWLLSWYTQGSGSSLLGVFRGVPSDAFDSMLQKPHHAQNLRPQVTVKKKAVMRDGKSLEVAWAARGSGLVSSTGAPLGTVWSQLAREPAAVQAPAFMSPRVCEQLVAAIGYADVAHLAVTKTTTGLQAGGSVNLGRLSQAAR